MKGDIFKPAIIAGLFTGVLSGIPGINLANCLCCLWVLLGGLLAGYLYQKESTVKLEIGDGFAVGALSGVAGAIISAPLSLAFASVTKRMAMDILREFMEMQGEGFDFSQLEQEIRASATFGFTVLNLVIKIIVFAIFGSIGGAIATLLFKPSKSETGAGVEGKTSTDS